MTPAERLRKNQRMLDKAIRELDQVRTKLEKQEKQLITQIKQSAQKGQMGACKIQAKDLVRTRRQGVTKPMGIRRTNRLTVVAGTLRSSTACAVNCKRSLSGFRYYITGHWGS